MTQKDLDPRTNAYRDDLAAEHLRTRIEVPVYSAGTNHQVVTSKAPLRRAPRFDAPLDTEVLLGENLTVYDENEGWSWVQLQRDNYVGYAPSDCLSAQQISPTHKVKALKSFIYPEPDIKAPPLDTLYFEARASARSSANSDFFELHQGGFVFARHMTPVSEFEPDFVSVAEQFLHSPYLWGGRSAAGIDCSGLVQISLEAAGQSAPRDSDLQEVHLGRNISAPEEVSDFQRGDLVFWKGHIGIMMDSNTLLHANAYHMETVAEPLAIALSRISKSGSDITSVKRMNNSDAD